MVRYDTVDDIWRDLVPAEERRVFVESGHGGKMGLGEAPALLVVDSTFNFLGDRPEPILASIARWPYSCGELGWEAVNVSARLLAGARATGIPVVFTTGFDPGRGVGPGRWADKGAVTPAPELIARGHDIVPPLAPLETEIVIRKEKPSAFFGTALISWIVDEGIDSLIVCGGTTSGCVRSTVIDAFSYNIRCAVVAEATFDRSDVSHRMSLFDLHQKYADVVLADEAEKVIGRRS